MESDIGQNGLQRMLCATVTAEWIMDNKNERESEKLMC